MQVDFELVSKNKYRLKKDPKMKVDAVFYSSEKLLPLVSRDLSLVQLRQTAQLPHLVSPVLGMPDMHEGYGIPVGGIMVSPKIVSAGCVGMDISCGVRLLRCGVYFDKKLFSPERLVELVRKIEEVIPMGLGRKHRRLKGIKINEIVVGGAAYLVDEGIGTKEDLEFCEEGGKITGASVETLSKKALERAEKEIGTLGSGNHFLELQKVEKIYDKKIAERLGLFENLICFMIHSGSRALGHQTCIDYTNIFFNKNKDSNPDLVPVKNLASAFVESEEGRNYLSAMNGAINFAFANRHMMAHSFRQVFEAFTKKYGIFSKVELVYDVAHNSAKWETHFGKKVLVHRKGATRALPPGHPDNPRHYRETGHPAFVPGSMGTASYVLVGTKRAEETFFSVNHGSGRAMSRTEAREKISKEEFDKQMQGIVFNKPYRVVVDEAPSAYKNVEDVIDVLADIGITKKIAKLIPLAVMKGD